MNITFKSDDKTCYGNCKCEKLLLITTRGMNIATRDKLDQATSYLEALSSLWGLGEVYVVSAQNMDYVSQKEVDNKIENAIKEGLEFINNF
jgi:FMN-dependent NADH-azoreductase